MKLWPAVVCVLKVEGWRCSYRWRPWPQRLPSRRRKASTRGSPQKTSSLFSLLLPSYDETNCTLEGWVRCPPFPTVCRGQVKTRREGERDADKRSTTARSPAEKRKMAKRKKSHDRPCRESPFVWTRRGGSARYKPHHYYSQLMFYLKKHLVKRTRLLLILNEKLQLFLIR